MTLFPGRSNRPCFSVIKWPARLPLSTVDMYLGFNGDKEFVSYQLYKWPRYFSILCIVLIVLLMRSIRCGAVIKPKSNAVRLERSDKPILVGEVRCAVFSAGLSW